MPQYTAWVNATSNSSAGTQDLFIEVKAASANCINMKRIRVALGSGAETVGQDGNFLIQLYRYNTTTAGTTASFTPVPRDGNRAAAGSTCKTKSGTTACVIGTTSVTQLEQIVVNGRAIFEWLARDDEDMWVTLAGDLFCIAVTCSVASQKFSVSCDWVE
jgi:hypothetical protein